MGQLLGVALLGIIAWLIFALARRLASESTGRRVALIAASGGLSAIGAACVFWLPRFVPETPGSPGTMVMMLVLWIVGGVLLVLSLPVLAGATFAKLAKA